MDSCEQTPCGGGVTALPKAVMGFWGQNLATEVPPFHLLFLFIVRGLVPTFNH